MNRPTATPRSLDATVDIETPEQVVFSYSLAGTGSRALAAIVDTLFCVVVFVAIIFIFGLAQSAPGVGRAFGAGSTAWFVALLIIMQFAILWGYYVLAEGLFDGRTIGKSWLGLRVVQDGGYSVTFASSAIRNLARVIDFQPIVTYGVALVSVSFSKSGKRIGDMLAGTIVVRERVARVQAGDAAAVPPAAADATAVPIATLLSDDEFTLLSRFVERLGELDPQRHTALVAQLATRFRPRAPELHATSDTVFLNLLHNREQAARARGVAARSDTGAAREQHALVATGSPRWSAFATELREVQKKGLANLPEARISDFVARYRELSADLARLKTASRGRELEATFALSRLVAAAHNVVYRQRRLTVRRAIHYMSDTVPREIRRSWRPIALAAAMLFGPAVISYVAVVTHPSIITDLVPRGMIERAERGVERAQNEEGYIPDPQLMRPVMATQIMTNNVQVTFFAFATGVTAGIGTLLLLVFNGVSFGSVLGLYQTKGILSLILAFVAPHSVLELGAICIAGGGGLLIAKGILLPGDRTRRERIVENGRRAIQLIAATTMFLVIAGTIEGFVSPIPWWPLWWKVSVTAVSAVFFFGFIFLGAGTKVPNEP